MADGKPGAPRGHPRWGGKQRGSQNHATRLREQAMVRALVETELTPDEIAELTPLAVLLRCMRAAVRAGDMAAAASVAAQAAPYCHSRLASSELHVTTTAPPRDPALIVSEIRAELAAIEAIDGEAIELPKLN